MDELGKDNPRPIAKEHMKKCKHGVSGLCTKCAYKNTGRRKSTNEKYNYDVTDFMKMSINKRLVGF